MSALPKHRELDFKTAIEAINRLNRKGEIKYLDIDIDYSPYDFFGASTINSFKIASGDIILNKMISDMGLVNRQMQKYLH